MPAQALGNAAGSLLNNGSGESQNGFAAFMNGITDKAPPVEPLTMEQNDNMKFVIVGAFLVVAISMIGMFTIIKK